MSDKLGDIRPTDDQIDADMMTSLLSLGAFETRMKKIAADYALAPSLADRRGAVCEALTAVHGLMWAVGMGPLVGPIFEMAAAIHAVHEGVALPLVKLGPRGAHAPSLPTAVKIQRAVVAAAVEQNYQEFGRDLSKSCTTIARWLWDSSLVAKTKNAPGAVKKWRNEFSGAADGSLARLVYRHYTGRDESTGQYVCPLNDRDTVLRELRIWGVGGNPKNP